MTFAWQGFSFDHSEDWAPVQLNGTRQEGYIRIASPDRLACQVRWKAASDGEGLADRLRAYLGKLDRDSRKSKAPFDGDIELEDGRWSYRYAGANHGKGIIFFSEPCKRVFFAEVIGGKGDPLAATLRPIAASFRSDAGSFERWSLLGLDIRLPGQLKVERTTLQAGLTRLNLFAPRIQVRAERWGFGEQLLAKHSIEEWAKAVLRLPNAGSRVEPQGVRLTSRRFAGKLTEAIVQRQADKNQILTLAVVGNDPAWRPQWDWVL